MLVDRNSEQPIRIDTTCKVVFNPVLERSGILAQSAFYKETLPTVRITATQGVGAKPVERGTVAACMPIVGGVMALLGCHGIVSCVLT